MLIKVAALLGWAPRLIDYHVPPEDEWRPHGRTASFAAVGFEQSHLRSSAATAMS